MSLFRYALGIEYAGNGMHGWQQQKNAEPTIQAVTEAAISQVANQPVRLFCAGRTDKGVHAVGQVAHFDCCANRPASAFMLGTNRLLPDQIRIRWVRLVPEHFHARFSAQNRRYSYVICNDPAEPALLRQNLAWWRQPLESSLMHEAAQCWLGKHDFSAFRGSGCGAKSPWRRVQAIAVSRVDNYVMINITADAFLLHMVRNMAGTLRLIGQRQRPVSWAAEVLASKDRKQSGMTASPTGLYLMEVSYDANFNLPKPIPPALPLAHCSSAFC